MNEVSLFAMGDFAVKNKFECSIFSESLKSFIIGHDFKTCNFEGAILSDGEPIEKVGPHIQQSLFGLDELRILGFDFLSLANNHSLDYGRLGIEKTIEEIEQRDMEWGGVGKDLNSIYELKEFELNGINFGFLSLCDSYFGSYSNFKKRIWESAYINHEYVDEIVKDYSSKVDLLILSIHTGAEHTPLPLPEWRNRYKQLIEIGGDLILGHHPHVPQGWEKHKDGLIFYSLGNSFFYHTEFPKCHSYCVSLNFNKNGIKDFRILAIENKENSIKIYNSRNYYEYLDTLNSILSNKNTYQKMVNSQALWLYNKTYRNFDLSRLKSFLGYIYDNLKEGKILEIIDLKNDYKHNLRLFHYIMIDSHLYAIKRALEIKIREDKKTNKTEFDNLLSKGGYKI